MSLFRRLQAGLRPKLRILSQAIDVWMIERAPLEIIDGIVVCDFVAQKQPEAKFFPISRHALALIRETDSRRYRRLCGVIKYIVNRPMGSGSGNYVREPKICNVDFAKYFTTDYAEWNLRSYACLLVHESTHGLLFRKGIPYNKQNWQRIEKLCRQEEYRFARRVDPEWADEYVRSFDPKSWKLHWGSRRARRAAASNRIREMFRSLKW